MTDLPDSGLPVLALAKLTELQHLADQAVEHWHRGDLPNALEAAGKAMPAAGGAAAALNALVNLERAPSAAGTGDRGRGEQPASQWWG
ncbi:hypothetical protein ACWGB8_16400 [Kitasatospora sp. NPDC054939]